jgi:hypothetical protein
VTEWKFADPPNVVTCTVRQIVRDGHPILLVSHDDEDGGWQFLTGGAFDLADALLVALKEIVALDPSIVELADLPLGWQAWRERPGALWVRQPDGAA